MMKFGFDRIGEACTKDRMFDRFDGPSMFHGALMPLIALLGFLAVVAVIIAVIVLIVRNNRRNNMHNGGIHNHMNHTHGQRVFENRDNGASESALIILNERYAKGEINQEEYLAKKNDLLK